MKRAALITGASSGLGWEFALQLAARGDRDLILLARREDRLCALNKQVDSIWESIGSKDRRAYVVVCDLVNPQETSKALEVIARENLFVDLLINNAGFGTVGTFASEDIGKQIAMIDLNCKAPIIFSNFFLPKMLENKSGAIVNVSSTASFQPMPYMSTYGATKSFLTNWTLAVNREVHGSGVRLMALCPGPTATEFHLVSGLEEKMSFLPSMTASLVVTQALNGIDRGCSLIVNGRKNFFISLLPRILGLRISARIVDFVIGKTARRSRAF